MWQEIAVYLIGCVTIFWKGRKIYRFFTRPISDKSSCQSCHTCPLKKQGCQTSSRKAKK